MKTIIAKARAKGIQTIAQAQKFNKTQIHKAQTRKHYKANTAWGEGYSLSLSLSLSLV